MKVSIITVCYNSEEYIEEAVKSALFQTYQNIEYIIIDGKSTDGTLNIINKYKDRISKIISEKDEGIYDAMNKGAQVATGDIIYFLNSDDRLIDKEVIMDAAKKFEENNKVSLIYGDVISEDRASGYEELWKFGDINNKNIIYEWLCHQGVFAKRYLFNKFGMFDTRYKIAADYDWLLKIFFNDNLRVVYFNRTIARFLDGGTHVKYRDLNDEERFKIKLKYYSKNNYYFRRLIYRVRRKIKKILKKYIDK